MCIIIWEIVWERDVVSYWVIAIEDNETNRNTISQMIIIVYILNDVYIIMIYCHSEVVRYVTFDDNDY